MSRVCHGCMRTFSSTHYVRCQFCRERSKVYLHQLFKRRRVRDFPRHNCALCRKHKAFVKSQIASWNEHGLPEERARAKILKAHGTFEKYIRWHRKVSKGFLGYSMTPPIP